MRLRLMVISSTFVLAACVPRAGTDYRVTSEVAPAAESNSQIVAEQDFVIEPPSWGAANVVRKARLPLSFCPFKFGDVHRVCRRPPCLKFCYLATQCI